MIKESSELGIRGHTAPLRSRERELPPSPNKLLGVRIRGDNPITLPLSYPVPRMRDRGKEMKVTRKKTEGKGKRIRERESGGRKREMGVKEDEK